MLDINELETQIKKVFNDSIPEAGKQAYLATQAKYSKHGDEMAEKFGKTLDDLCSEHWAKGIAAAIDYYIKSGMISGTVITTGSPVTQTAIITPINLGNPAAGSIPNTFKIT